jgi:hypothetical protein
MNGNGTPVDGVAVTEHIPACASYVSSTNPTTGGTTSYASGVVTASMGTLGIGQEGTFTVTVQASLDTLTCASVDNANYSIAGTGVSPTIGPPVSTPIVNLCDPTWLAVNTGWDQAIGIDVPVGAPDNEWMVVADPSPSTAEPRPAFVVNPNPAWSTRQAKSSWVSSSPTAADVVAGHYVFEYRFCLDDPGVQLRFSIRADDEATVYLNGNNIGSTVAHSYDQPALFILIYDPSKLRIGDNVLTVDVNNIIDSPMGFDAWGLILGDHQQYRYCCSDSSCGLLGTVWNDGNRNGIKEEQGSPGETVTLMQGTSIIRTTTTDGLGNYYFMNVVPGNYQVAAVPYALLSTPVVPAITLAPGDIVPNLNFGYYGSYGIDDSKRRHPAITTKAIASTGLTNIRPNPFNPETTIEFSLSERSKVSMTIYDVSGKLIRTLADGELPVGDHAMAWNGRDNSGQAVSSGVYFLQFVTNNFSQTKKLIVLK